MIEIFNWNSTSHFVKRCAASNLHFTKIIDWVFASKKKRSSQESKPGKIFKAFVGVENDETLSLPKLASSSSANLTS